MNAQRPAAGLALVAAALLVGAEFATLFDVVVGPLEVVRRSVSGADNHSYALLVIALLAVAMAPGTARGARPAAASLVVLGCATLAVALAVDLPDTRASGRLPEAVAYENARARAGSGLYLEIAGGALLIVAGAPALTRRRPASGAQP